MEIKSWIINRLEKDVEPSAGHIELENLTEEDREEMFKQFGEGDVNLTEFLRQSYKSGLPSIFCCSGHGIQSAYVTLKITDENMLNQIFTIMKKCIHRESLLHLILKKDYFHI